MDPGEESVPLENKTPDSVMTLLNTGIATLQQYGWFILLCVVAGYYIKVKYLNSVFERMASERESREEYKKYDTDTAQQRLEAMERARQRLQENFNEQAAKYAEEQKKKEEIKRQSKIEDWDRHLEGRGYRNKYKPEEDNGPSTSSNNSSAKKSDKKKLRPSDYNPLMGDGGGNMGYRPTRRGFSSGGG